MLLLVAGGAFQTSKGFVGLHLSNQRDLANANRMLSVMEQMPEFGEGEVIEVELVGRVRFSVPGAPFSNEVAGTPVASIVDCSGLACQNRLVHMLNLIGGGERPFVAPSRFGRAPAQEEIVAAMPSWPEPGSIRYLDGTFVVKGRLSGGAGQALAVGPAPGGRGRGHRPGRPRRAWCAWSATSVPPPTGKGWCCCATAPGARWSAACSCGRPPSTPSTAWRSRRPAAFAGPVVVEGAGRFALGPLWEVAAGRHPWDGTGAPICRRGRAGPWPPTNGWCGERT